MQADGRNPAQDTSKEPKCTCQAKVDSTHESLKSKKTNN